MSFDALEDIVCPPIDMENIVTNSSDVFFGAVVSVECEDGFKLVGSSRLTCNWDGWNPGSPYCQEESSSPMSPLIIIITTLATLIAFGILIVSIYMLIKNCSFEKMKKTSAKAYEEKMRTISDCFGVSQDCVGMPAVVTDNYDDKIRGRSVNMKSASVVKADKKDLSHGLEGHFEPDQDDGKKEFLY